MRRRLTDTEIEAQLAQAGTDALDMLVKMLWDDHFHLLLHAQSRLTEAYDAAPKPADREFYARQALTMAMDKQRSHQTDSNR